MKTSEHSRTRSIPALAATVAALALSLPASAAAQLPELQLSATAGALPASSLTLKARCPERCTLALKELSVMRFDGRRQQVAGAAIEPLKGRKAIAAGRAVKFVLPLAGEQLGLTRSIVAAREYAHVTVVAEQTSGGTPRQVSRTAALHQPGMPKLTFSQDDVPVRPARAVGGRARWRVSLHGVQTTRWQYDRDERRPSGCTIVANGNGVQRLRFASTKAFPAKVARTRAGAQYFDTGRPSALLLGPISIDVDRTGRINSGTAGTCGPSDGVFGGTDGNGGPPVACNGKGKIAAEAMLSFEGRKLLAMREPLQSLMEQDTGIDCPVQLGERQSFGDLMLFRVVSRRADLDEGGRQGKVILVLRGSQSESIPGGRVTTTARWTVTFRRV